MKPVRLLPIVIVAGTALTGLKFLGLMFDGSYLLTPVQQAVASQQTSTTPSADASAPTVPPLEAATTDAAAPTNGTATNGDPPAADQATPAAPAEDTAPPYGQPVVIGKGSKAERAVLERLGERRKTLELREKEIELREQLLKAAEQRLEQRIASLKALEEKIGGVVGDKQKREMAKFGDLVKMYESMKPKAAAKIFDRLELAVMVPVAKQMNPRKLGDVMARMTPEAAEKLTVALANNSYPGAASTGRRLPKIVGKKPDQQ